MWQELRKIFSIPELRAKIVFTLLMIAVVRVGVFIPVPGIDSELALSYFRQATGGSQNLFQLVDNFTGGAFAQMSVCALGVMPYISSSIIMQMLVALWPSLQREMRENQEAGKRKISKYTRLLTLLLAFAQSFFFAKYAIQINYAIPGVVAGELLDLTLFGTPWLYYLIFTVTMTTGTCFLMWIGEQITEKGIGNGMSLIIAVGIVSQLPSAIGTIISQLNLDSQEAGQMNFATVALLIALFVIITLGTILIIQGHRRIPLQYARRVIGSRERQGGTSYIPLKVNYAGVIPVIFASSLLMFPATIASFMGQGSFLGDFARWMQPDSWLYLTLYVMFIIFLTYFWTAMQFRPDQIASDMKKNGAFVPGIRQGKPTQDYLESTMNKITLIGALSLAFIAILPNILGSMVGVPKTIYYFFGGTTLLILVGVVLDTMKQIESHLLMKRYDGFMKRGRVQGR